MKKKCSIISAVILSISLLIMTNIMATAHEWTPRPYRWANIVYNAGCSHNAIKILWNMDNLIDSSERTNTSNSISNWKNNSNGYFLADTAAFSDATVDFSDAWPSNLGTALAYNDSTSHASLYQKTDGTWVNVMYYGTIYINSSYASTLGFSDYDKQKTAGHEIGHCFGFSETNDGTQSIMRQGMGSTFGWSNYWLPQDHDRADAVTFTKIWAN